MKRLIFFLALLIAAVGVRGQVATIDLGTKTVGSYGVAVTLTNTTAKYNVWNVSKETPISATYSCLLTKLTGTPTNVLTELYGKCFIGDAWTLIASDNSSTITSTYQVTINVGYCLQYRYFKTSHTGTGIHTTKVTAQNLKIWLK